MKNDVSSNYNNGWHLDVDVDEGGKLADSNVFVVFVLGELLCYDILWILNPPIIMSHQYKIMCTYIYIMVFYMSHCIPVWNAQSFNEFWIKDKEIRPGEQAIVHIYFFLCFATKLATGAYQSHTQRTSAER